MKKFLAVFDGYKFSKSTMDYAIQLSKLHEAGLVGVFLDDFIYHTYSYSQIFDEAVDADNVINKLDKKDKQKRDKAVSVFQKACTQAGVNYSVHRDENIAIQELKQESLFADLIIINKSETFTRYKEKPPTHFIKNLLADVQCPVLVVPDMFSPIDKIILLYDGKPSSLYAIKMFSYLLKTLKTLPIVVYTVKEDIRSNLRLPGQKLMREFIKRHYPGAEIVVDKGDPEKKINGYLKNHKENELVVMGAYRRSELSRLFKTSMADRLMKRLETPIFIAHT